MFLISAAVVLADWSPGWKKWLRICRTASSSSQQVWDLQKLTRKDLKRVGYVSKIQDPNVLLPSSNQVFINVFDDL